MNLQSRTEDGILVLTPDTTRIDASSAVYLKDQFRASTEGVSGRIVMDLGDVNFVDSSGLGAIVSALKVLKDRKLELAGLTPVVAKVFKLTCMDQVFIIHNDIDSALLAKDADAA